MADEHHPEGEHHDAGAHEVDLMPNRRLFNLLFSLSALTLLACIGVVQLFNRQVDSIESTRGAETSFQLEGYRKEMTELATTWGRVIMMDDDGISTEKGGTGPIQVERQHMPVEEAKRRVLADPALMKAAEAYRGWELPPLAGEEPAAPDGPAPAPGPADGKAPAGDHPPHEGH